MAAKGEDAAAADHGGGARVRLDREAQLAVLVVDVDVDLRNAVGVLADEAEVFVVRLVDQFHFGQAAEVHEVERVRLLEHHDGLVVVVFDFDVERARARAAGLAREAVAFLLRVPADFVAVLGFDLDLLLVF